MVQILLSKTESNHNSEIVKSVMQYIDFKRLMFDPDVTVCFKKPMIIVNFCGSRKSPSTSVNALRCNHKLSQTFS